MRLRLHRVLRQVIRFDRIFRLLVRLVVEHGCWFSLLAAILSHLLGLLVESFLGALAARTRGMSMVHRLIVLSRTVAIRAATVCRRVHRRCLGWLRLRDDVLSRMGLRLEQILLLRVNFLRVAPSGCRELISRQVGPALTGLG